MSEKAGEQLHGQQQGEQSQEQQQPQSQTQQPSIDPTKLLEEIQALKAELEALKKKPENTKEEEDEVKKKLKELETFKQKYYEEKVRNAILSAAKEAVDPEAVFIFLSKKAEVSEDGRVLIDGKPVEEAVKELLEKKPYLRKVEKRKGSNPPPVAGEPKKQKSPREIFSEKFAK
jgi:flagellar motor protein MotB